MCANHLGCSRLTYHDFTQVAAGLGGGGREAHPLEVRDCATLNLCDAG